MTHDSFAKFWENLDQAQQRSVSIAGYLVEGTYCHYIGCGTGCTTRPTTELGTVSIVGMGGAYFERMRTNLAALQPAFMVEGSPSENTFSDAVRGLSMFAARLLSDEVVDGRPLKERFGGGYQIVIWDGAKFRRCESMTFMLWDGTVDKAGTFSLPNWPSYGFAYGYRDDVLVIRSWEPIGDGKICCECFQVRPVYRELTALEERSQVGPRFDADLLVNYLSMEEPGEAKVLAVIDPIIQVEKRILKIEENGNELGIEGQENLHQLWAPIIKRALREREQSRRQAVE